MISRTHRTSAWVYTRFVKPSTREPQTRRVHVRLTDAAVVLAPDYVERMLTTKTTTSGTTYTEEMWDKERLPPSASKRGGDRQLLFAIQAESVFQKLAPSSVALGTPE